MNQAETLVFKNLQARERNNQQTDLTNMYRAIYKTNPEIDQVDFLNVFKKLQEQHAGVLVIGRNGNSNRFIWKYNLKEVAEAALKNHSDFTKLSLYSARVRRDRQALKRPLSIETIDKMLEGRGQSKFADISVAPIIKVRKHPKNVEVKTAEVMPVIEVQGEPIKKARRKRRTKRAMKAHALKSSRVKELIDETSKPFDEVPVLRIEIGSNAKKEDVEALMQLARELAGTKPA